MAKHEKKRGIGLFQIADRDKVIFGVTGRYDDGTPARQMFPEKVPAGAFYGRDERGLWIFPAPVSSWRGLPAVKVTRFNPEYHYWYEETERGTALYRLIQSYLPIWDEDDRRALGQVPTGQRYHNPRSLNKGFREGVARRERKSMRVTINPAELSSGDGFEMGQRTAGVDGKYTVDSVRANRRDGMKTRFADYRPDPDILKARKKQERKDS